MPFGRDDPQPTTSESYWPACERWQQGDYSPDIVNYYVLSNAWLPEQVPGVLGAVIVSQTCDVVREDRPQIQLAAIVQISDRTDHKLSVEGHRPRYHHLPASGEDHFIDFDTITTVHKGALIDYELRRGARSDTEVRNLAAAVARKFGRFAYPDDVVDAFKPITKAITGKAHNPNSPLGRVLGSVHSFRVGCEDWNDTPRDLTLHVIMNAGVLPAIDEASSEAPKNLANILKGLGVSPTADRRVKVLYDYLNKDGQTADDIYWGWQNLVEAWADQCVKRVADNKLSDEVGDVTAELTTINEFTLDLHDQTHSLDLDYLSDSRTSEQSATGISRRPLTFDDDITS